MGIICQILNTEILQTKAVRLRLPNVLRFSRWPIFSFKTNLDEAGSELVFAAIGNHPNLVDPLKNLTLCHKLKEKKGEGEKAELRLKRSSIYRLFAENDEFVRGFSKISKIARLKRTKLLASIEETLQKAVYLIVWIGLFIVAAANGVLGIASLLKLFNAGVHSTPSSAGNARKTEDDLSLKVAL